MKKVGRISDEDLSWRFLYSHNMPYLVLFCFIWKFSQSLLLETGETSGPFGWSDFDDGDDVFFECVDVCWKCSLSLWIVIENRIHVVVLGRERSWWPPLFMDVYILISTASVPSWGTNGEEMHLDTANHQLGPLWRTQIQFGSSVWWKTLW